MAKVLVAGTDDPLGASLAIGLAQDGHTVAAGSPQAAWPDGTTANLHLEPIRLDLTSGQTAMEASLDDVRRALDGVDWVVLPGRTGPLVPVEHLPTEVLDEAVAANLIGPIRLLRDLVPDLRRSGDGRIVVISSLAGAAGLPASAACSATRAGLEAALDALRYELLPDGIKVSVIQAVSAHPTIGGDLIDTRGASHYGPLLDTARELRDQASRWSNDEHVLDEVRRVLESDHPAFRSPVGSYAALAAELQDGRATPSDVVGRLYRLDEWVVQVGRNRPDRRLPAGCSVVSRSRTGPSPPFSSLM